MKKYSKVIIGMIVTAVSLYLGYNDANAVLISEAENDKRGEYYHAGYSLEVAVDQAAEDFGREGELKTGGVDGKMLDGSVAPNNQLGLSATPKKTECSHDWVETDRIEANCQNEGKVTYTCTKCGKTKTEKLPKTDHDYTLTEDFKGTCTEKAHQTFVCSVCGDTYTVDGNLGEHNYVKSADSVEPTCTEKGNITYTCSICGDTYTEEIDALGHDFSAEKVVIKEPTCTEDGLKAYVCNRCGEQSEEEILSATGHEKSETPVAKSQATFWNDGVEEYRCVKCGEVMETVTVPATGGVWRLVIPIAGGVLLALVVAFLMLHRKKK